MAFPSNYKSSNISINKKVSLKVINVPYSELLNKTANKKDRSHKTPSVGRGNSQKRKHEICSLIEMGFHWVISTRPFANALTNCTNRQKSFIYDHLVRRRRVPSAVTGLRSWALDLWVLLLPGMGLAPLPLLMINLIAAIFLPLVRPLNLRRIQLRSTQQTWCLYLDAIKHMLCKFTL